MSKKYLKLYKRLTIEVCEKINHRNELESIYFIGLQEAIDELTQDINRLTALIEKVEKRLLGE